jgi:cbb3-type cytochrome oxidase maturation protein
VDILLLLVPLSVVLVLAIAALFAWAVHSGQFDDLEQQGQAALHGNSPLLAPDQVVSTGPSQQSPP